MWLLVVLIVVESRFVIGGGDETGFGCGFHVLHVESRGKGRRQLKKTNQWAPSFLEKCGLKS